MSSKCCSNFSRGDWVLAEHQSVAVRRSLDLLQRRGAVLLADEVGLGKSFIAAAVLSAWSRVSANEMAELIVPAALVAQWRHTLLQFETEALVLTHDGIVSDPYFPRSSRRLVIVDEAHAFRNPGTRRYAALARRCAGSRVMLVTATPVCNSMRDLESLLRLVARDDLLAECGVPSIDVAFENRDRALLERVVTALVIRRDRSVLPPPLQFGSLERRVLRHPVPDVPLLHELQFPLVDDTKLLRSFLRRRLESSHAALLESLRRQQRFYERALAAIAAGRTLPKRDYREAFAHEEDRDAFQEVLFWELFAPPGVADPSAIRAEMRRIELLREYIGHAPDNKRRMLLEWLRDEREPVLIFTGSAATAADLHLSIGSRSGLVTSRSRSRGAVLQAFVNGHLDVVVSTDMAAEGLNLQRAGVVVHYDIPWNPVKLDQRNGRAHRIGQQRESVRAIYFIPDSRGSGIMQAVARKNRIRRKVLDQANEEVAATRPTLRPRVTRDAACCRLARCGFDLPESLMRRHRAGIETIIEEMSREFLDQQRVDDLVRLTEGELCPP
jgi:superfamily II DNA or RNA helicase